MELTLRKALNVKNRLIGEVHRLTSKTPPFNCHREDQPPAYELEELLEKRKKVVESLIALKTAIATANVPIYEKIARVAELKTEITMYQVFKTSPISIYDYDDKGDRITIKTIVKMPENEVDDKISALQKEIEALNDEIDYYNGTTKINVNIEE